MTWTLAPSRRLEALTRLLASVAHDPCDRTCTLGIDLLLEDCKATGAALFGGRAGALTLICERGLRVAPRPGARHRYVEWAEATLRERAPRIVSQCADGPHSAGALLVVPIEYQKAGQGAVALSFQSPALVERTNAEFVQAVATVLGITLARNQQEDAQRTEHEELEDTRRMASLGFLTASVAHELRGPTGALVLQVEEQRRLLEQLAEDEPDGATHEVARELLEITVDTESAITKVRETLDQLSSLSRREHSCEQLDLSAVVREALAIVRPQLDRRGIRLVQHLNPGTMLTGRRDTLTQMVLNLVFNAADACELKPCSRPTITVRVLDDIGHAELLVEDTGPGVDQADAAVIFRPFYTTKARGKGTGIGLKICSDVAAAHGGTIDVCNLAHGGARFRVQLPRDEVTSGVHPIAESTARPLLRRRKLLVVDDDLSFVRSVREAIPAHDVRSATAASEAELALLDPTYHPEIVLCAMSLPGTSGHALHAKLVASRPELAARFLFVTGTPVNKIAADYARSAGIPVLDKPVAAHVILDELVKPSPASSAAAGADRSETGS